MTTPAKDDNRKDLPRVEVRTTWYCIPLAIPQLGHFQSSFCTDSRQLENLLTRRKDT